ncbi:MAG: AGE family epimerase/isomerase [Lachnospiraceae bacterium]|nr:AGE family epimerase/isomerase [Lachnospiraceae bacterium]
MFREETEKHLRESLIPFWMKLKDDNYGGYFGFMDNDLNIAERSGKGCLLNSRILWFFSTCALLLHDKKCLDYAGHAFDFLKRSYIDDEFGGLYWSATFDGNPLDTCKHTYCQAFAVYGLSAYYRASGNKESLALAKELTGFIEEKCRDENGYLESFNRDLSPSVNDKLSENGVIAERTMNTLLHVFEAYTELYEAGAVEETAPKIKEMLRIFKDRMYDPARHCQKVFFDKDYNSLLDLVSYGHDIETSWLLDRGLEVLGDEELTREMTPITDDLADNILHNAFDGHSLPAECEKGKVNEDRIWWAQAETVNGFLNKYLQDPSKEEYKTAVLAEWEYIKEKFIYEQSGGEWYSQLDANGVPYKDKPLVEPWKCPYHNGRMCLEVIRRDVRF